MLFRKIICYLFGHNFIESSKFDKGNGPVNVCQRCCHAVWNHELYLKDKVYGSIFGGRNERQS